MPLVTRPRLNGRRPPACPHPRQVNETLNACTLDSVSCTSTLNDDEAHFAAPWQVGTGSACDLPAAVGTSPASLLGCLLWHSPGLQPASAQHLFLLLFGAVEQSITMRHTRRHTATHCPAPRQFDGDRDAAVARLLEVVTGGNFELGLIESFGGIKQTDAAVYIAKGVLAVATGASPGRCAWDCGWGDRWQAGWRVRG